MLTPLNNWRLLEALVRRPLATCAVDKQVTFRLEHQLQTRWFLFSACGEVSNHRADALKQTPLESRFDSSAHIWKRLLYRLVSVSNKTTVLNITRSRERPANGMD